MALNIKNRAAEELAREVSKITGETMTQAIICSLADRLERLRGRRSAETVEEELIAISRRCRDLPDQDPREPEEILGYGPRGAFGH